MNTKSLLMVEAVADGGSHGWIIDRRGYNIYSAQPGDTYQSLAGTYLGDESRWPEIWWDQSDHWRNDVKGGDFTNLAPGDELYMPQEAVDAATALGWVTGGQGAVPGHEVAPRTDDPSTEPGNTNGAPSGVVTLPEVTVYGTPSAPSTPAGPPDVKPPDAPSLLARMRAWWGGLSMPAKVGVAFAGLAVVGGAVMAMGAGAAMPPRAVEEG